MSLSHISIEIPINGIFRRSRSAYLTQIFSHNGTEQQYHWSRYANRFKYKKLSRRSGQSKEEKKRLNFKFFLEIYNFRGARDKKSSHSSTSTPQRKTNSKKSKNLKNGIYVQWITPTKKKKYFVLAVPERDNMQLRVVNYIFYGKATRKISDTSIQLVRTYLNQDNKSSSIEEARASFVKVRINDRLSLIWPPQEQKFMVIMGKSFNKGIHKNHFYMKNRGKVI
ncbi:hypothetical protein Cgig2_028252 [Carnegiea gigantea]|uniref:Uncharacterized protein n=1 Tax=Carnegiea gigantea TaxID=171969 RepID=A0A9Q1GKB1_9CARY|nr:hypothetical protein Cgig2_028252 [Carnegiea gigantea]